MDGSADVAVSIRFEGRPLSVRADTSVAVALWEQGVRVLSHSPKYGRARGLHCARGHCTSCLMRIDGVPNVRACETPVRAGMCVERQDAGAMYGRPLQRLLGAGSDFFPVGLYYKWFTRPAAVSRLFLRMIRPLTGIGRLPDREAWAPAPAAGARAEADRVLAAATGEASRDLGVFDSVIVGAGAAGLEAAAGATGRVLLVDDHAAPGGQRQGALAAAAAALGPRLAGLPVVEAAHRRLERAAATLPSRPGFELALGSYAAGAYEPDLLVLRDPRGLSLLRTRSLVWAAGALDVTGLFDGNDLPGILGPRGLYRAVVRDGLRVKGRPVIVAGGGLDLWLSAALLHARGARLTVVLGEPGWPEETRTAVELGWKLRTGLRVTGARSVGGLLSLRFDSPDGGEAGAVLDGELAVLCERGKPAYDLPYQLGAGLVLNTSRGGYVVRDAEPGGPDARLRGGLRLAVAGEAAGLKSEAVHAAAGK